jgi:hypothetical protein
MPPQLQRDPVQDTVPQINNELAVGEDLEFQRKWWRFEHVIWAVFTLIIIADVAGVFGRGPLAKTQMRSADGSVEVKYERVERFETPAVLSIKFGPQAIRDGKIQLWVSQDILKSLGVQRVVPQPESSALVSDGMLYTFPARGDQSTVEMQLQPTRLGRSQFHLRSSTSELLSGKVFIMP